MLWPLLPLCGQSILADGGGAAPSPSPSVCLTNADRAHIRLELSESIAELEANGLLAPPTESPMLISFQPCVVPAPGSEYFNVDAISNYVDQNTGSALLDYECGSRTYNGHLGTDLYTWPFSWYVMDNDLAHVVAGAAGTIIYKHDGEYDRQCSWGSGLMWNAIYIQHADGSIAWYGHLKNGSLTSKGVGDVIAAGEYLGVVGSSGYSTGPHLHLEIYDASGSLVDPYAGSCNSLNASSWWASQEDYRNSRVNRLITHAAPPVFPSCPTTEVPNDAEVFTPGSTIYYGAYFRDQEVGQFALYTIRRPDGTGHDSWSHSSPMTYSASYWYFTRSIPTSAQLGTWTMEVQFEGETYSRSFQVCTTPASCACPTPTGLAATAITGSSAVLSWTAVSGAIGYQISGGPVGAVPKTLTRTSNSVTVNVLNPSTTYQWQVRAGCGGTDISPFSSTHTFSTPAPRELQSELLLDAGRVRVLNGVEGSWQLFSVSGSVLRQQSGTSISIASLEPGFYLALYESAGTRMRLPFVVAE